MGLNLESLTLLPILVGLVAIGVVLLVIMWVVFRLLGSETQISERLNVYADVPVAGQARKTSRRMTQLARMRYSLNSMMSSLAPESLSMQIATANWQITETEFMLIRFAAVGLGFLIGWLVSKQILPGLGLAVVAYIVPGVLLNWSIRRRQESFERQLVDILVLMVGAVRAGYSLVQSMDVVVRELKAPASEEFARVLREISLGLPVSQALLNLTDRMQNDDLYLVVTAININIQVGGNLASMLDAVAETIRDRIRLFAEVRMLTSQQRFNSYLLTLLPFGVAAMMFMLNPNYISRLFEPGPFLCIPIGAIISVMIGNIVIRRLSHIEV